MFSNGITLNFVLCLNVTYFLLKVHGSAKWNEFLEFMGSKIELKGWPNFSGGLDTHQDTTGKNSIFSVWKYVLS